MGHPLFRSVSRWAVLAIFLGLVWPGTGQAETFATSPVTFLGDIAEDEDLSAGVQVGKFLLLATDEGTAIEVMVAGDDGSFTERHRLVLDEDAPGELDLEGLAAVGNTVWALGSHSRRRKTVGPQRSREKNRKRLETVDEEPARAALFRFRLETQGGTIDGAIERLDLRQFFENDPILAPFRTIPSKENGIDLEGLAVRDGKLYLGFRGPVLRGHWVPVMVLDFDKPEEFELRFVRFEGRGVRSLEAVEGGFLAIAGPVGDGDASYQLYFWDGEDTLPDDGASKGRLELLGELPTPEGAKAEGLVVSKDEPEGWEIVVIYDGVSRGAPARMRVPRPIQH